MPETEIPDEARIRKEVYFFLGQNDVPVEVSPEIELAMMRIYGRAYVQGFNSGIDFAVGKIIEGISDGVEFVASSLKLEP